MGDDIRFCTKNLKTHEIEKNLGEKGGDKVL